MTTDPRLIGDEPDVAAAELALGLLEGDDRAAALRRQLAEPAFARDVERWRDRFAALFSAFPVKEPDAGLEQRILSRLDPASSRPGLWRPFAIASSLAAASLLGVVLVRPDPIAPPAAVQPTPMVAAFMIEGHKEPTLAVYDAARGQVRMPGPMPIPKGRSAQLWAIVGNQPPHPLGLFHLAGGGVMADASSPTPIGEGTMFAISIEPLGGSPTGLPTGPVVASARLSRV
ncbi:MAG: anti-sigma factor [Sphingomonas bacterium]|nr:anti-sigma factor [Sphingomonas bacterium]